MGKGHRLFEGRLIKNNSNLTLSYKDFLFNPPSWANSSASKNKITEGIPPVISPTFQQTSPDIQTTPTHVESAYPWEHPKNKNKKFIVPGILAGIGILCLAIWYFGLRDNIAKDSTVQTATSVENTSATPLGNENANTIPLINVQTLEEEKNNAQTAQDDLASEEENSKLKFQTNNTLTEDENKIITEILYRHTAGYESETDAYPEIDYQARENDYANIVSNYYNKPNKPKEEITTESRNYFTKIVSKSRWEINNKQTAITKNNDGSFIVDLFGDYYFNYQSGSAKYEPDKENHLSLHNRFKINSYYKITEEYEVSRRKIL